MHDPEAKPDADYTTQQAADQCGISINTLLAWERRYGVPSPRRNDRDERVYNEDDLRTIRWLREKTAQGTPIGRAVQLLDEMPRTESSSDDVVMALDVAPSRRTPEGLPTNGPAERSSQGERARWQRELTSALIDLDRPAVTTILGNAALESSPLIATRRIVVPVMQALIARYDAGELDRAIMMLAERWLGNRIAHWLAIATPPREHAQAITVLVTSDRRWMTVASLAMALRLAHDGRHVIDLSDESPVELIQTVVETCEANQVILVEAEDRRAQRHHIAVLRSILPPTVDIATIALDEEATVLGTNIQRANERFERVDADNQPPNHTSIGPEAAT